MCLSFYTGYLQEPGPDLHGAVRHPDRAGGRPAAHPDGVTRVAQPHLDRVPSVGQLLHAV